MSESYDLVLRGGECVTPSGREKLDVGVRAGKICALGVPAGAATAKEHNVSGLTVLPGVIDSQVHFREPGLEHKEDLTTGTRAAVAGGVTTIFEMPNTKPNTDSVEALADKVRRGTQSAYCNFAFFVGATGDNAGELGALELEPGCCGVKVFMGSSTGTLLVADQPTLERVLRSGRRRVAVHCEDEQRLNERKSVLEGSTDVAMHPVWRDEQTAILATQRLLEAARKTGRAVHVLHVTTSQEMEFLASQKDIATVEATPQHLTLAAPECYQRLGSRAQMNPPIRSAEHQAGLWAAINSGVVDVIGSDHAPHTLEEKAQAYPKSPSGMPGVQTTVPIMLNHVNSGKLSLERLVDLLCHGPARIFNIAGKGRLAVGYDADLTVVDMNQKRTLSDELMKTKSGWTPFAGMAVRGWPRMTIVGGQVVMNEDEILATGAGAPVQFWDVPGAPST